MRYPPSINSYLFTPKMIILSYKHLLIAFLLLFGATAADPLQLNSVSSSPLSQIDPQGSVDGGTTIYISGLGFDTTAGNNQVFIGNYPCLIPADGATDTILACVTTPTGLPYNQEGLAITVYTNGQQQTLSVESGSFSYTTTATPYLSNVFPSSSVAGTTVNFWGTHKISNLGDGVRDMGDVINMKIGSSLCGRFDTGQTTINPNSLANILCFQASIQEGGKYNVSEYLTPGYSDQSFKMKRSSFNAKDNYHFAVLPAVYSTTNSGAVTGNDLFINGTGFSNNQSKITVSVDGVACGVTASSLSTINCTLKPKLAGDSSLLTTNATAQNSGYFSGSGLKYDRFNLTGAGIWSVSSFKTAVAAGTLQNLQSSFRGEIETGNTFGSYYGQFFRGYFKAPADGVYTFRGVADDAFALYMSPTYGSVDPTTLQALISSNSNQDMNNFWVMENPAAVNTITLKAGMNYYMEVYHINLGGSGHLRIAAEMPNADTTLTWQTHAVQKLTTNITNDPEIIEFTQKGLISGKVNLTITRVQVGKPKVILQTTINYNASISEFITALSSFDSYWPYGLSGVLTMKDSTGAVTTNAATAVSYTWRVSINLIRTSTQINEAVVALAINSTGTMTWSRTNVQPHGPLMGGTFGLQISFPSANTISALTYLGSPVLPYNIAAWQLQAAFQALLGFQKTEIILISDPALTSSGSTFLISYYNYQGNFFTLVPNAYNLTGGVASIPPQAYFEIKRNYSSNLLVDPIDFPFLFTPSGQSNVLVTVNGLQSVCMGNCGYTFITSVPQITALSQVGSTLLISLSDPSMINYSLADTTITFNGFPCAIVNTSAPISFCVCQLPINLDTTASIIAGIYMPVVTVKNIGKVLPLPTVSKLNYSLSLTSVGPSSGGANGGYQAVIAGVGIPYNSQSLEIYLCGQSVTIVSVTNIGATIIVPPCVVGTSQLTIKGGSVDSTNSLIFNYTAPTTGPSITSIAPISWNPVLKGVMEIFGSGFGTNTSALSVFLSNSSGNVYAMRILQQNHTYIKCGIPGGLPGKFQVQVSMGPAAGYAIANPATANDFTYELVINSVSPSMGSYFGGTLLNIQGINFSPDILQTLVFVGNELNWMCSVESLNKTNILCRTPPISPYYNQSQPQVVVLSNKLVMDNTCGSANACQFSYNVASSSPSLTSISTTWATAGDITLMGTNLNAGSSPIVVLKNQLTNAITLVTPKTSSATSVVFTLPSVESGPYDVKVRSDPVGQTNSYTLNVNLVVSSLTPSSASVLGGNITITGNGLPSSWPNTNFVLSVNSSAGVLIPPTVLLATPTKMVFSIPTGFAGAAYPVTIIGPLEQKSTTTFSQASSTTPQIALISSATLTAPGTASISLNRTTLPTANPQRVFVFNVNAPLSSRTEIASWTYSGSSIVFSNSFTAGKYGFAVFYDAYGWANCTTFLSVTLSTVTIAPTVSSYYGGNLLLVGAGLSTSGTIKINGVRTPLTNVTASGASAKIPSLVTALSQSTYSLRSPAKLSPSQFTLISDSSSTTPASSIADNTFSSFYSSNATSCYVGIDIGQGLLLELSRLRFFPYSKWVIAATYLVGATWEGSTDAVVWSTIQTVDSTVHSGWNIIIPTSLNKYRYVRFRHNSTSMCKLSEADFDGIVYNDVAVSTLASNKADAVYEDGANTIPVSQIVEYRADHTAVVASLDKTTGDVFGGYTITISGTNLNFDTPSVTIDGVDCPLVGTPTATSITCTVGARLQLPASNYFSVMIGQIPAIVQSKFQYVMRWSDIRTWGTDLPPVAGDLVYVPKGMNLLVDQSTPLLTGILVENGTLTFDDADMTIQAGFITVKGGAFVAGTQAQPFQHQLTFIMSGSYYGAQQPMFGNKGIACLECKFSMIGQTRNKTWTTIAQTITAGTNTLTLSEAVDWKVGEQIVVAATSFDHNEAEMVTITAVNGLVLTVNQSFVNSHYSGIETYGSDSVQMRAEVGLLTRNIKMMGDEVSQANSYGAHLMMAGSAENGLQGRIAYTEFTKCGQPKILGRYCIHFHMNGEVSDSYVRGNAVHHSMARVVTLHGVHFLTVEQNVGYRVQGHNFFVEDGIETNNLIQDNLAIGSLESWTMLQTDISVASFWITNPTNTFRNNRAAGGDFYGFWFQIKSHPDGPSSANDVCPMGNPLGQVINNTAHSYRRFGLRIFKLAPRTYPCQKIMTWDTVNPFASNPTIPGVFENFLVYKNGEAGVLAEETGDITFKNIRSVQNKLAGIEFYRTVEALNRVKLDGAVIVGVTQSNAPLVTSASSGIITPRQGQIQLNNVRFNNYPAGTYSLETCSKCNNLLLFTNTGQEIFISNVTFTNVSGNYLKMLGLKREIIYDSDGTFSNSFDANTRTSATVVNNFKHIAAESNCLPTTNSSKWDTTLACDQTLKLARVRFTGLVPSSIFINIGIKVQLLSSINDTVSQNSTSFTEVFSVQGGMDAMISAMKTYALPFVSGRIYSVWWLTGLDFDHLNYESSRVLTASDAGIIFKFNYTLNRELYEIGPIRPGTDLATSLFTRQNSVSNSNCTNGEYAHSNDVGNRVLQVCASAQNRTWFEWTDVTAIYCRYLCPAPPGTFVKENFVRIWSNTSQWPNGVLPAAGENVTVNGNWTIIMDMDPAHCDLLTIDGDVIIENFDRNINCNSIWIRAGSLKAGSAATPYTSQLAITLNGLKNDPGYVFDPTLVGNKIFVVTGLLSLYGVAPATLSTRLLATAFASSQTMSVASASGWSVGDSLGISPSFSSAVQYERVTITAISGNTVTFTPALAFTHYGAPSITINNSYGTLDTRSSVIHLNRNIKFISGPDNGWGYTIIGYNIWEGLNNRIGQIVLSGVEFQQGGQYDTEATSLHFQDLQGGLKNYISKSSFSYCRSFCIKADNSDNIEISDNVFFEGRKLHLSATSVTNFIFNRNVMMGAIARPTFSGKDLISCVALYQVNPMQDGLQLNDNICQGSQGIGFALPFLPCDMLDSSPFLNNLAGSCNVGFLLNKEDSADCAGMTGVKAYACSVGELASPPNTKLATNFTNFILVDNQRAMGLRFGLDSNTKTAYLSNSFISAISRPNCTQCYGSGKTDCANNLGVRMLATTINGEHFPKTFDSGFDVICRSETFDNKAFFYNVTFENFNQIYSEPALIQCNNNIIFRPHPIDVDLIGTHHLWNSQCNNCSIDAYAYFDPPKASELGWAGGCGSLLCTGRNNYMIHDHSGTFLPTKGILIANNTNISSSMPECVYHPLINGHYCPREDFGVLEYQSIAPDFNTRIMWPVYLSFDGGNWLTWTNAYKEWEWEGGEPLNKRLGRFISLIQLQKVYNMTFEAMPPVDMVLQIQERIPGGNSSDWAVVKLYYPFPNSIAVEVGGNVIRPISLLTAGAEADLNTSLCGSNKFFYQNYTIHFVVTGEVACQVRVYLTNSIQLTLRFAMDINTFYSDNLSTKLIDRMCALLQISDMSRVKIVGIYNGSVQAVLHITEPPVPINQSTTAGNYSDRLSTMAPMQDLIVSLYNNGMMQADLAGNGFGEILSMDSQILSVYPADPVAQSNKVVIIAASVGAFFAILIIVGVICYLKWRLSPSKVGVQVPEASSSMDADKKDQVKKVDNTEEDLKVENISDLPMENIREYK